MSRSRRRIKDHGTRDLRELLGCSQQEMADLMGISQSVLARSETGARNLPVDALAIYNHLAAAMTEAIPKLSGKNLPVPASSKASTSYLRKAKQAATVALSSQQTELAMMEVEYQRCLRTEELLKVFHTELPGRARARHDRWRKLLTHKLELKKSTCDLKQQHILRVRIAGKRAEIQEMELLLATA